MSAQIPRGFYIWSSLSVNPLIYKITQLRRISSKIIPSFTIVVAYLKMKANFQFLFIFHKIEVDC